MTLIPLNQLALSLSCLFYTSALFVDPLMGDNGCLYQGFDRNYVEAMKAFCQQADVIIPNLTEAALLTDTCLLYTSRCV